MCEEIGQAFLKAQQYFLSPKKNGSYRLILNLKELNKFVCYEKFKMDHIYHVLSMVHHYDFLSSIDLTEAYSSVFVSRSHWCYLMFEWKGETFCYTCIPSGISNGPCLFTRLCKPLLAYLCHQGVEIVIYIDDTFLRAANEEELNRRLKITMHTLEGCGFLINHDKSVLHPTQKLEFLGFDIDTVAFTISLLESKRTKWKCMIDNVLRIPSKKLSICQLAKIIGTMVATFPCSLHAQLHYRVLEHFKMKSLAKNSFKWTAKISLSRDCIQELQWWASNLFTDKFSRSLQVDPVDVCLFTDTCDYGFGHIIDEDPLQGVFSEEQKRLSINTKELLAIYYAFVVCKDQLRNKHVLIHSDSTTALSCIRKRGSQDVMCDRITVRLYEFASYHNITISGTHISGFENSTADRAVGFFLISLILTLNGPVHRNWLIVCLSYCHSHLR